MISFEPTVGNISIGYEYMSHTETKVTPVHTNIGKSPVTVLKSFTFSIRETIRVSSPIHTTAYIEGFP